MAVVARTDGEDEVGAARQRTSLAWQRTVLSLVVVDVAVLRLASHGATSWAIAAVALALLIGAYALSPRWSTFGRGLVLVVAVACIDVAVVVR